MVRNYKKKSGRKNYVGSQAMVDAIDTVVKKQMSATSAAKNFGVDKRSLLMRVRGDLAVSVGIGRRTALTAEVEFELVECLQVLGDWGWGFTKQELRSLVQEFCTHYKLETQFKDNYPGPDWLDSFMKRYPSLAYQKTRQLSSARACAQDPDIIRIWFELLDRELTKTGVKDLPEQIFYVDESAFVTDPKAEMVFSRRVARQVNQTIGGSGREQITVNCCGSASGVMLPPFVIYLGENLYADWTLSGPQRARYSTSEKGWMEGPHFLEWFQSLFLKETEGLKARTRLLICDCHVFHLTLPLIHAARVNNVVVLRPPVHLIHLLQPLDTCVFQPIKLYWQKLMQQYAKEHNGPVSKQEFPQLLNRLYLDSFTQHQVKSGFTTCGIFPFDPHVVLDHLSPSPFTLLQAPSPPTTAIPSRSACLPGTSTSRCLPGTSTSSSVPGTQVIEQCSSPVNTDVGQPVTVSDTDQLVTALGSNDNRQNSPMSRITPSKRSSQVMNRESTASSVEDQELGLVTDRVSMAPNSKVAKCDANVMPHTVLQEAVVTEATIHNKPQSTIAATLKEKHSLSVPNHQVAVMSNLLSMWKVGQLCDSYISNGSTDIMVHKMVLGAVCPKVLPILHSTSRGSFPKLTFPSSISKEGLLAFVEYMYSGVLDLNQGILVQLHTIAQRLEMEDFELLCSSELHKAKAASILTSVSEPLLAKPCYLIKVFPSNTQITDPGHSQNTTLSPLKQLEDSSSNSDSQGVLPTDNLATVGGPKVAPVSVVEAPQLAKPCTLSELLPSSTQKTKDPRLSPNLNLSPFLMLLKNMNEKYLNSSNSQGGVPTDNLATAGGPSSFSSVPTFMSAPATTTAGQVIDIKTESKSDDETISTPDSQQLKMEPCSPVSDRYGFQEKLLTYFGNIASHPGVGLQLAPLGTNSGFFSIPSSMATNTDLSPVSLTSISYPIISSLLRASPVYW